MKYESATPFSEVVIFEPSEVKKSLSHSALEEGIIINFPNETDHDFELIKENKVNYVCNIGTDTLTSKESKLTSTLDLKVIFEMVVTLTNGDVEKVYKTGEGETAEIDSLPKDITLKNKDDDSDTLTVTITKDEEGNKYSFDTGEGDTVKSVSVNYFPYRKIALLSLGSDGRNKEHYQENAYLSKTGNYTNETIKITYNFDEIRKLTLGKLDNSTGEILLSEEFKKAVAEPGDSFTYDHSFENVDTIVINIDEDEFGHKDDTDTVGLVQEWTTDETVKELHPIVGDGSSLNDVKIENITKGSVVVILNSQALSESTVKYSDKGSRTIFGRATGKSLESYYEVEDDSVTTENGVLYEYTRTEITVNDVTSEYWVRTKVPAGHVYYNTGVIELNKQIPYQYGIKPSLYCKYTGLRNLKLSIKDKGSDGNNYSVAISKFKQLDDENIIYNLNLYRGNNLVESIKATSREDGAEYDETLESGEVITVSVPYLLDLEDDYYSVSFLGDVEELKSLEENTYSFVNGTDGNSGITAEDYIGYKLESGEATGAWCFDNTKYAAQLWPSLGFTDKNFYLAMQEIAWNRKDTTCVLDIPKTYGKSRAINWRESEKEFAGEPLLEEWWQELYYNWCTDTYSGQSVDLPPSYYVTLNSLKSYAVNGTWKPVAGLARGTLNCRSVLMQVPAKTDRDDLITHNINPIVDTGNHGIQIYGNETLNGEYTDLTSAHIARTLTYIRYRVDTYTETLKFELNDVYLWRTWNEYVSNKILTPIKAGGGLQWFRVSMGRDTTTAEEIAQRIVRGVIELQFTQDAEIFLLDYVVYSSAEDNTTF